MIDEANAYLSRIDSTNSTAKKQTAAAELQAFYQTLSEEQYELVKEKLLTPQLNELKVRMAKLDELIDEVFFEKMIR